MKYQETIFDFQPRTARDWLLVLAGVGIAVVAPQAGARFFIEELKQYIKNKSGNKAEIKNQSLSQALYVMKKRKLIKVEKFGLKTIITLTEKGRKMKLSHDAQNLSIKVPKVWDGKWRLIMFDIPEDCEVSRRAFRNKLKTMGFVQFQRSVWLYPYPCEEEIDFLTEYMRVGKYLTFLTVGIEDDLPLRARFKL